MKEIRYLMDYNEGEMLKIGETKYIQNKIGCEK